MISASSTKTMAMTRKEIVETVGKRSGVQLPFKAVRRWVDKQTCCVCGMSLRQAKQKIWLVRHKDGLGWLAVPDAKETWRGETCYVHVVYDTGMDIFECVPMEVEDQAICRFFNESGLPIKVEAVEGKRNRQTIKRPPVSLVH